MEPWLQTKRTTRGVDVPLGGAALVVLLWGAIAMGASDPGAEAGHPKKSPIRIQSEQLVAEKAADTAEFSGAVRVEGDGYTISADHLTIHFRPGTAGGNPLTGTISAKEISRIAARGQVRIRTDALTASAEQAVYEPDSGQIWLLAPDDATTPAKVSQGGTRVGRAAKRPPASRVRITLLPTAAR